MKPQVEVPEVPRRPPGKKDRRTWCGGHVGRRHDMQWRLESTSSDPRTLRIAVWIVACALCGKRPVTYDRCSKYWPPRCVCGHHGDNPERHRR